MAQTYREVRHVAAPDREVEVVNDRPSATYMAARVVSIIGGLIMFVLALRFLLSLLGANSANAFASFIYNVSRPFVAPFFGLFNYQPQIGTVRFEWETLVAILFWGAVTWFIVRLITIGDRRTGDV